MRPFVLLFGIGVVVFLLADFGTANYVQPPAMERPKYCEGMRPPECPRSYDPQCTIGDVSKQYANKCKLCEAIKEGQQPEDVSYKPCDPEY